jgi:general secretion pathway protein F
MVVPRFVSAFATLDPKTRWAPLIWLERAGNSAIYWGPVVPALLILAILFYASTGRSAALRGGWTSGLLKRIPWVGRMLEQSQAASFSEMLALLVDQGVPLDEGIRLAADAAGDEGLRKASLSISEGLRSGQSPSDAVKPIKRFPPLVRWLLTTGRRQAEMASALRHAAETYRRRAMRQADLMRIVLPNVLLLVIAAGATLLYALTLFGPMSVLLRNLTVG